MGNLIDKSIEIILKYQHPSGAYIASPNFKPYEYCWFRDGSFIAYAMDLIGNHESSQRFHNWAASTICRHQHVAKQAIEKRSRNLSLSAKDVLHTRYRLDGSVANSDWPNFQLDGFGTWLWSVKEHTRLAHINALPPSWRGAIKITSKYLCNLWSQPNYDCWEEFGDKVHTYTLGAIYAGLNAATQLLDQEPPTMNITTLIRETIFTKCIKQDHLIKFIGSERVDANLIGLSTPYRIFEPNDPIMMNTISQIESNLQSDGNGVHRYDDDTYYGGGEWVLLTAWLGWYYAETGLFQKANKLLSWVEEQADDSGYLPEQIPNNLVNQSYFDIWTKRHGKAACPLLWSHASYLILAKALREL